MAGVSSRRHTTGATAFGSRTDIGCVRDHNEDSLVVAPPLYVVADGMGGHAAGEVASEICTQVLADRAPAHADATELGHAVEAANRAIIQAARDGVGREGMGTTCTAAILEGERLVVAQVGDSRAYLLHHGRLQQLTRDHSLMADMIEAGQITPEEALYHPQRSVITRAMGSDPRMHPDLYEINVETGDRLLLCSDGLSGMISDGSIEEIMNRTPDAQLCASKLVNEAITAGGFDNVTVIVANVTGFAEVRHKKLAIKTKATMIAVVVFLLAAIAAAGFGLNYWISNSAYLGVVDGKVAVYRGVTGDAFGMKFSELDHVTDISISDIQPGVAKRLSEGGIQAGGMKDAERIIEEYRQEAEQNKKATSTSASTSNASNTAQGTQQ